MAKLGKEILTAVVGIAVGFFVLASVLPQAFDMFFAVDTSSWDSGVADLWGVIPILALVVLVAVFAGRASGKL